MGKIKEKCDSCQKSMNGKCMRVIISFCKECLSKWNKEVS